MVQWTGLTSTMTAAGPTKAYRRPPSRDNQQLQGDGKKMVSNVNESKKHISKKKNPTVALICRVPNRNKCTVN